MRYVKAVAFLVVLLAGCGDEGPESDAYGNFEADEIVISSEMSGKLLEFRAREGRRLAAGAIVAVVDTTGLALQRSVLRAHRAAAASKVESVRAQLGVLDEKQQIAARERARFESLVDQGAAARKQLDDAADQIRILEREKATVATQLGTIRSEIESIDARIAQISDQISRSVVRNPVDGVVLASYAEPHELAAPGKALYEIADVDTLYLRAYVSGGQLPKLRLGQEVEVLADQNENELRSLPGTVAWIADEAEFTPKLIQTREERVNLVYAVKIRVPNPDGLLKIGMPGELRFTDE